MAFKKREYKYWFKFFDDLVFKNGCNPYLLWEFQLDLVRDENYEGAKAAADVFKSWFAIYAMSEKETEGYLITFYGNHSVYGRNANFPILKHPGI